MEKNDPMKKLLKGNFADDIPSPDFTDSVMHKIARLEQKTSQKTAYKPIISKSGWVVITLMVFGIAFMGVLYGGDSPSRARGGQLIDYFTDMRLNLRMLQSPIVVVSLVCILSLLLLDKFFHQARLGK